MSEWKKYKLKDLILNVIDNRGKTPPLSDNGEFELIETNAINGDGKYPDFTKITKFVSLDTYNTWFRKGHPKKGNLLISTVGDIGKVAILNSNRGCIAQNLVGLEVDNTLLDNDYLYYYLIMPTTQAILRNLDIGSVQPSLKVPHLLNIDIALPELKKQKSISTILNDLDKKIELNTQLNQTLEQIAQATFKSWFIDFDPVRAKIQATAQGENPTTAAMQALSGKTSAELAQLKMEKPTAYQDLHQLAEAFPCEMAEVDGVEVPLGWGKSKISDIAKVIKGKSYKSSELEPSNTALVTLKSFNRGGGYRLDGLKEYSGKYKPEQEVFAGDLIIAYTDVTQDADVIGKPAMVMSDSRYEHLVISLDVGVVRPRDENLKYFLYCLAMTEQFKSHTKSFCTGTTVLHLGKDAVPSFEFVKPSNGLLEIFSNFATPIFQKINGNIETNKDLERSRNLLLPRLLNGEL